MSTRKSLLAAAVICGTLLLMAGVAPVWAQSETPPTPDAAIAGPDAPDAIPSQYLSYQGTLRDNAGNPDNGTHSMSIAIYDNAGATGTALFTQSFTGVQVRNGHFSLLLSGISAGIFSGADRFLQLTVDGNVLTPTQSLAPVPYAVSANYANSLAAPDGDPLAPISVGNDGNISVVNPYSLGFGSSTRQMLNLYGTNYGIGVQGYTQYYRSSSNFAWYTGGTHSDTSLDPGTGGTAAMVLQDGKLGIGTTGPDARVTTQEATASGSWLSFKNTSGTTKWHVNSYNDTGLNFAETSVADGRLFIKPGGNVGIGTTNPVAKLDVNGDIFVAGHKPVIFRKFTMTNHCYANFYSNYDASAWSCGIVSWKVNGDIDESGKQYPLLGAWTSVRESDNDWVFSVDVGNACGEEWEFIAMCVDNRLVQWDAQWDFPASSSASSVEDEIAR
jgi:hypothetical protein